MFRESRGAGMYTAGITATQIAPFSYLGGAGTYRTALGDLQAEIDQGLRLRVAPPVAPPPVVVTRSDPALSMDDVQASWAGVQRGWKNPDCRPLALAALAVGYLLFGR